MSLIKNKLFFITANLKIKNAKIKVSGGDRVRAVQTPYRLALHPFCFLNLLQFSSFFSDGGGTKKKNVDFIDFIMKNKIKGFIKKKIAKLSTGTIKFIENILIII